MIFLLFYMYLGIAVGESVTVSMYIKCTGRTRQTLSINNQY